MTALQDWLSDRPLDPRSLKTLICEVMRGASNEESAPPAAPTLLRPGVERC